MSELSVFADESGDTGNDSRLYLLTLVFHDQANPITEACKAYEERIGQSGLADIPFHMQPLIYREGDYANMDVAARGKLLNAFHAFTVRCPIRHASFIYDKRRFSNFKEQISQKMAADIQAIIDNHYTNVLGYDQVKIYYDNGQSEVRRSLHGGFEKALANNVPIFKENVRYREYRLCQVADMICGFELLRLKFGKGSSVVPHESDLLFFDNARDLRNRYLKKVDRLRLS